MEKIPYIRKISMEMDITQALISSRLGWSQQQYCDFQEDAGYIFIAFITRNHGPAYQEILSFSGLFWKWWRNQWFSRDMAFYELERLQPENYIYLHTEDLETDRALSNNFWSHSEGMFFNGRRVLEDYARQKEALV